MASWTEKRLIGFQRVEKAQRGSEVSALRTLKRVPAPRALKRVPAPRTLKREPAPRTSKRALGIWRLLYTEGPVGIHYILTFIMFLLRIQYDCNTILL